MIEKQQAQQATGLEKLVLGAIMSRPGSLEELMQEVKLAPEMFYNTAHQTIFNAILNCNPYDLWTITQYLIDNGKLEEIGGAVPLAELVKYGSTNGEVVHHAKVIVDKFIARQTWEILQKAAETCQSPDDITDIIAKLTDLIPSDTSFFELEKKLRVSFTAKPNPDTVVLYVRENDNLLRLLTRSNMSMISGHAKAGKTFLNVILVSSFHTKINELFVANGEGTILIFDTEQSMDDMMEMVQKICPLIDDEDPVRIKPYALKSLTPPDKIKFIDDAIKANPDTSLVIIDGIRDLLYDINSPVESTEIIVKLMNWVADYKIHIINVLHLNKTNENPRGHLGTELQNKIEVELCVEKDRDGTICTVEPKLMRHKGCKPFSFFINDNDLPELCDTPKKEEEGLRKQKYPKLMSDDSHFQTLDIVFKNTSKLNAKEFEQAVRYHLDGIGRNTYLLFAQHYKTKGWVKITKGEGNEFRNHYYEYQRMS